nr:hypothetical protein [Clostridia bacterium]
MFRKRPEKNRLEMTQKEARLLIAAIIHFRNRAARDGMPTEDINVLDHIILGPDDRFYSLREHCEFPVSEMDYAANIEELSFAGRQHKDRNRDDAR